MKHKPLPPAEFLRECFTYNPRTGKLVWKTRPVEHFPTVRGANVFNRRFAGTEVGSIVKGHLVCRISGYGDCQLHRIIWCLYYGEDPGDDEIDHRDVNPSNNRIRNLRRATHSENLSNTKRSAANTSGVKGVSWDARRRKWRASLKRARQYVFIAYFDSISAAEHAVVKARSRFHKEFANHG